MFKSIAIMNKEYPKDWKVLRLGDACINITDGSHFSPKDDKNGEFRIGTVANMTENKIDIYSCKKISKEDYEMLVKNGCKPKIGDVLFSKDGTVGLSFPFKQKDDIVLLSSIAIISLKENINSDYCACVLKSPFVFKQIEGSKRGTGLRRIILHDLKRFQIPLPPLPEQRRIAEVLGTVDSAIQKVGVAIERTERLKKGLMQRLLTRGIGHERFKESEVGRVPEEWEVVRLGDACQQRNEITMPSGKGENKFVGLEHINPGEIKIHTYQLDTDVKSSKFRFRRGDILYGKLRPYLDKAVIADFEGICSTDLLVLTNAENKALAEYIIYLIHSNQFIQNSISATSGTNHPRTSWKEIGKFKFGLPPLPEQRRIAEILSAVDRKLALSRRRKEKLERVKKGLMNELLTGRKRLKVE